MYSPDGKQPWDDAVTLVLTYAEIPYDVVYDTEILTRLAQYDWLHLHHEDFTGQYGKFYRAYRSASWYQEEVARQSGTAEIMGFQKVSEMKRSVATNIRDFVLGGGFLFTMCSGTDSYDIALAAQGVDICGPMFDGDPSDPAAQSKLRFEDGLAFQDYQLEMDPLVYEFSDIDGTKDHGDIKPIKDSFTLFDFSAKWDVVPTMLPRATSGSLRDSWAKPRLSASSSFVPTSPSWATTGTSPRPSTFMARWDWDSGRIMAVTILRIIAIWSTTRRPI